MKQPPLAKIPTSGDKAPANKTGGEITVVKHKKKATKAKGVKKSFSMTADDAAYVEKLALKLGQKRGKSMSDSEALRAIIAEHRGQ